MKSPITKLAAAVVIIAMSLSLIPFNNSISSSAYAFEQTIEANNSIRNLHILMSRSKGNKYLSVEIWARCDNNGKATNLRAEISDDISEDDNQIRYFTWNDGILEIWWPLRNALYVCRTNENEIERYWRQLVNEYNPIVLYQRLYDESKLNESIELNINDLSRYHDFIRVQFKNHDNDTIKELLVDSKTKLVKQYTERDFSDDENTFDMKIEYLSYNQPFDESIFKLSEIPDNVMVYDRTNQLLGLEQGELTDNEIAKVLVQSFLQAAIAKNYEEVSRLMESELGDTFEELIVSSDIVEKFFRNNFNANLEQVISIGEPKSYMSWLDILYVPCKVKIKDEKGSSRIVDIQITVKSVKYESSNRWIINSLDKMGLILSGESVGDYQIGMSKDDVLKRLGKPKALFYGDERYTFKNLPDKYYMAYNEISFYISEGLVEGITALGPSYKFPNGLSVGDTEESVIQAFGDDFRVREFESKDFLYFDKEGLMFEIDKKNRTVLEINIFPKK